MLNVSFARRAALPSARLAWILALAFTLSVGADVADAAPGGGPAPLSTAVGPNGRPAILDRAGIEPIEGAALPRDVRLTGSDGRSFALGEYADGEKPLVLVFAYFECPMLCSLVISGLEHAMQGIAKTPGLDFRVLVVSFDPRDTPALANGKRLHYVADYGREVERSGFEFATGSESEVRRIADAVGFHYEWDESTQQYAHAAGVFVVAPDGKLTQALLGTEFEPSALDGALNDADKGVWRSPLKSALLYCFHYDPLTGRYVPAVVRIMKVGVALAILAVGALLLRLYRADRKRARANKTNNPPGPTNA